MYKWRRTAVRETGVSRHHGGTCEGHLQTSRTFTALSNWRVQGGPLILPPPPLRETPTADVRFFQTEIWDFSSPTKCYANFFRLAHASRNNRGSPQTPRSIFHSDIIPLTWSTLQLLMHWVFVRWRRFILKFFYMQSITKLAMIYLK